MFEKFYLSRAQTRAMSSEMPIGDPTGGAAYGERNDPVTATMAAMTAAQVIGGGLQANAAENAADAQLEGTYAGIAEQRRQFNQSREDLQPYRKAGYGALDKLSSLISSYQPFDGTELANDPGYQFGLREGRANMEQGAAARGNLFSTKTLRDLIQFGNDYGSTKFNERGMFRLNEQNQRYNQLAGVAGTGQNAVNAGGAFGQQSAGTIADLLTQGGNARAAGLVGGANAINSTMSNLGDLYLKKSWLDRNPSPMATSYGGGGGVYGA
jgi:hypothetical protein